jgi:tetratricopeptide (TPR) repeat protein
LKKILSREVALALLVLASSTAPALAQNAPPAPPAPPAPNSASGASNYLRCDGRPNNVTTGETVARLIGAVTLLGLFAPAHEAADASKRLFGAEGVAACDSLLAAGGEGNPERRAQLQLARALHRIEMKDYDAAIADAKALEAERQAVAATPEYRLGLGLDVRQVQALALAGMGKREAAADMALDIAEAAPYDMLTAARVEDLVALGGRYGEREKAYYDRAVKLIPALLISRAEARQNARDYRGAAQDYELLGTLVGSYMTSGELSTSLSAHSALMYYLAGDGEAGARKEAEARAYVDKQTAAGKTPAKQIELLDFVNIVKLADRGDLRQARLLFAGRTRWTAPTPSVLADMAARLRKGASAEEMIGLLAKNPSDFIEESRGTALGLINAAGEKGEKRFTYLPPFVSRAGFDRFSANLWRDGQSRYFGKKADSKTNAWMVSTMRDGGGIESSYALLLASALEAKRQGHSRFAFFPLRTSLATSLVRLGDSAGPLVPEEVSFDSDRVIADLRPLFPAVPRK